MKRGLRFLFVIILSVVVSACSFQKDMNVTKIEVLEKTVPDYILAGEFDKAGIEAMITYEDGTTENIKVNSNLLKDAYQEQINVAGEYEVEILFKGASTKFKVKIVEANQVHIVKFFNGFNELVSMQIVEDGKDAEEPSGKAHLINGYDFIGWDRTFTEVKEDINVYGIYTKVGEVEETENEDFSSLLLKTALNMTNQDIHSLEIFELDGKRFETTRHYDNRQLKQIVEKVTNFERNISYFRYSANEGEYEAKTYRSETGFFSIEITADQFYQYDFYSMVKGIVVNSSAQLKSSALYLADRTLYKVEVSIANVGDGGYENDVYEFVFDEEKIISLKHFVDRLTVDASLKKELVSTVYYLEEENKVFFPTDVDLLDVVEDVYNNDVKVISYEMGDVLFVEEIIYNDVENNAAKIQRGQDELYAWEKEQYMYYTKEAIVSENNIRLYKTTNSIEKYSTYYYYQLKNLSNYEPEVRINQDDSVSFVFNLQETSGMRAHCVEFVTLGSKLVKFEKYYVEQNEKVYIEKSEFSYGDIQVSIPEMLIEMEANAIVE